MIAAFEMLERNTPQVPAVLSYVSTHPNLKDRLQGLREEANQTGYTARTIVLARPWKELVQLC
jgi:predicted Zn-dependent protease